MSEDNYSLSSRVFHTIRENILSGKYATDEELKEKSIGEELGVSRTPVREALRQLELEGLVTIIPNKGAYVVGISQKDIRDIYEIRSGWRDSARGGRAITSQRISWMSWRRTFICPISTRPREIPSRWWSLTTSSMKFYTMRQAAEAAPHPEGFSPLCAARAQGDARRAGESGQFKRGAPQDCGGAKAA